MAHTRRTKLRLDVREERLKLKVAGKPYYEKLQPGLALGYRRNQVNGVWVLRQSDGRGGNTVKSIGTADDYEPVQPTALSYWQARDAALARRPEAKTAITVAQALDEYQERREKTGANNDIMTRVRALLSPLADRPLADVTQGEWHRWQDTIPGKDATVNRLTASIKAAFKEAAVRSDIAEPWPWMKGLPNVQRRGQDDGERDRNVVLSDGVIRQLVAAAYERDHAFGLLVDLSAVTGVRYSQLARCQVQDLQGSKLTVRPSRKGKPGKSAQAQVLEIGAGLADRLRVAAAGRPVTDPLLLKKSREPWKSGDQFERFRDMVKAVGQDPKEVSIYALRHSHITRQLLAGHPIRLVAVWHDTSSDEIERRYARNIGDHAEAPPAPDYGPVIDTARVVSLRS